MGIHGTEDAGQRLIRGGVEPSHPRGAALRKAARSRHVWSKSVKRQVRKGGMDAAAREIFHPPTTLPPQAFSPETFLRRVDFRSPERRPGGFSAIRSIITGGRSGNRATR